MFFLVLRRTLARGWQAGLVSGAGIATGDGIYAAIAAFGVTAAINLLVSQRRWIGLIGGIAIALIGLATLVRQRRPAEAGRAGDEGRRVGNSSSDYLSTLGLTLSNPPTILSFLAVFAGLGVRVQTGWLPAAALVLGVLIGSALWWVLLSVVVVLLRRHISSRVTAAIGLAAGLALLVLGILITLQSV